MKYRLFYQKIYNARAPAIIDLEQYEQLAEVFATNRSEILRKVEEKRKEEPDSVLPALRLGDVAEGEDGSLLILTPPYYLWAEIRIANKKHARY